MKFIDPINEEISTLQAVATIAWLCFLFATAATGVVFSLINPETISACTSFLDPSDNLQAYSIGFLFFWLLTSCSCLSCYFFLQKS